MQISFSRHLIQLSINSASSTRGFHGICRKSFLPRQVCFANLCGLVGERFSPTPPFFSLVWRAPGDVVLPSRVAAAALPPDLSASGGQLFIALRATAEGLRCAAFTCVVFTPCSFAARQRSSFTSAPRRLPRLLCRAETLHGGVRAVALCWAATLVLGFHAAA